MSWWDDLTNPINKALNSTPFKVIFPVQALAQGLTKMATGMEPATQYATGGAVGAGVAGLHALAGSAGSGMVPYTPTSAPNMNAAGSTLGAGGAGSPLNLISGSSPAAAAPTSQILQAMRLGKLFSGGDQQQPQQQQQNSMDRIKAIYEMFPNLRPGSSTRRQSISYFGG